MLRIELKIDPHSSLSRTKDSRDTPIRPLSIPLACVIKFAPDCADVAIERAFS